MERPVEVVVLDRGQLQSVRVLSPQRERWTAALAGIAGAGVVLLCMGGMTLWVAVSERVVHAPTFFVSWGLAAIGVACLAARWARQRCERYRLGADMDADSFAMAELDLVRRQGPDYDVGIVPGMTGSWEADRATMPIEALTAGGGTRLPMPCDGRVRIELGSTTFVLRRRGDGMPVPTGNPGLIARLRGLGAATARRLARTATLGITGAALATYAATVPAAHAITEADSKARLTRGASPWEVEQFIRARAQLQASALHQCFDPMPLACQRSGYVGVGLSVSADGEVLSRWISRSSYGQDCPVTECMANVAASWVFEPIPAAMKLVLPIQVVRTRKPLGEGAGVTFVSGEGFDAGSGGAEVAPE